MASSRRDAEISHPADPTGTQDSLGDSGLKPSLVLAGTNALRQNTRHREPIKSPVLVAVTQENGVDLNHEAHKVRIQKRVDRRVAGRGKYLAP